MNHGTGSRHEHMPLYSSASCMVDRLIKKLTVSVSSGSWDECTMSCISSRLGSPPESVHESTLASTRPSLNVLHSQKDKSVPSVKVYA